jgi:hypothetical protein
VAVPVDQIPFHERTITEEKGDFVVTVAVLTRAESADLLGFEVDRKGVQPIWIEIENKGATTCWFFMRSVDPEYFSPLEVAWMGRKKYTKQAKIEMAEALDRLRMPLRLPPGQVTSGFVFANEILGGRQVVVQVIGDERSVEFDFFVPVPGLNTDYARVDAEEIYDEYVDLDDEGFRRWIREQPCCVTNAKGTKFGDPLNLVIVEGTEAMWPAFARAGWNVTEVMSASSVWRTIKSSVFKRRYLYSPISPLYVFGRPQDIALQKARGTVDERNHLRLWLAPVTYNGHRVAIGQISRDIGIRFTTKSPTISTHKIDPDVDETRAYMLMDLIHAEGVARFAFEKGVGESTIEAPRGNLTDDIYITDGFRLVLFLSEERLPAGRVQYVEWERPLIE